MTRVYIDEFLNEPVRPGDVVDVECDFADGRFKVGATGWVRGVPVVWVHGKDAPYSPVPLGSVKKVYESDGR